MGAGFCAETFSVWDSNGAADFSACFEDSVLSVIVSLAGLVFAALRIVYLRKRNRIETKPKWHITGNRVVAILSFAASVATMAVVFAVVADAERTGALVLSSVAHVLASAAVAAVLYVEHTRLYRASTGLMVYWLLCFWVLVVRVRTRSNLKYSPTLVAMLAVETSLVALSFVLENMTYIADPVTGKRVRPVPLGSNVNVFARVTYWYMQPLLVMGSKRELSLEDLWRPDKSQATSAILKKFNKQWSYEKQLAIKKGKSPHLTRALLYAFYPALVIGFFEYCISFACTFMEPLLLSSMLTFIGNPDAPNYIGYAIAGGIFLNALLNVLMGVQMWITSMSVGYQIRSSLCSSIFRKSLNLSNTARQSTSTGQINNMLAADTNHIMWFISMIFSPLGIPVKIAIALYLLWDQLGAACLGGLAIIILAFPLQGLIGKFELRAYDLKQSRADARIEVVNETLNSIKLLKLFGWDVLFHQRVSHARQEELKSVKTLGILRSFNSLVSEVTPLFVSLASFAIFSAINAGTDTVLDAKRIFVSFSLFGILSEPIGAIGYLFSGGSAALTSLNRMQQFLLLEELDSSNVDREISKDGNAIRVENASFKWDAAADELTLQNLDFAVPKGALAAVIGRVGTGKSSLISTLLGEMHKVSGSVRVSGSIAYVSQQAWIENATVCDNILFGAEYQEARYNAVIDACALRNDLKLLSAGDQTEIGEKGVNLSGGQKQRLALARAVYNDADVYILDDVLSAVDAHVDKHIFDHVIGPNGLLRSKTRIFVTHGVHHLPDCDRVLVVKDKTIEQQGSYTELMAMEGGTFKTLMDEYARDVVMEETASDEFIVATGAEGEPQTQLIESEKDQEKDSENAAASEGTDKEKAQDGKLMTKEDAGKGLAKATAFVSYAKAAGIFWVVLSFALLISAQAASIGTRIWLDHWSTESAKDPKNPPHTIGFYLGIYAAIVFVASSLSLSTSLTMYIKVGQNAAKVMHSKMLHGVMYSPMSFFDMNPLGRITNRFVGDIQIVDESLVETYVTFFNYVVQSISTVIVICSVTPLFLTLILPLFGAYYYLQHYYLKTAQAVQRTSRLANSPVYALANTTFAGISTVRAFGKTGAYTDKNDLLQDDMQTSFLTQMTCNKWLQYRLECLGACISFGAAVFAVVERNRISAGSAGLSLGYALMITQYLYHSMRMWGQVQNSGVSLERIFEYFNLPSEAPQFTDHDTPEGWPRDGRVVFKDLKMRYREGTPLVLKGISVEVKAGEKVGIVGRTGAGKSSLSVALFRLSEADEGVIEVDGIDVAKVGLNLLRTRLTIIPQEPVLFGASVRDNIDPDKKHSDEAIWSALEASHLKARFSDHEEGLEQKIKSGGENMSVGERQLFCLARAILRNTKVLILDEATAGIDLETDALIQATIRREFKDSTVLTIAHRIQTIMDSDKIMVLNAGTVEEMDSPANLLLNPRSAFSELVAAAGVKEAMVKIEEFTEEDQLRIIKETGVLDKLREREAELKAPKPASGADILYDSDEDGFESGSEDDDDSDEEGQDETVKLRKWNESRKSSSSKPPLVNVSEGPERGGNPDTEDLMFHTVLMAIPLTVLQSALEYVIHVQYSFSSQYTPTYVVSNSVPFFVALLVLIYSTSRFKSNGLMQIGFALAGAMSGVYIVKMSAPGVHQTFGDMMKAASVAVVWIYCVIQCRLGYVICSTGVPLVFHLYQGYLDGKKDGGAFGL
ncbi:Canalicular multispecific organic anion transporter 2 [Chytriomyces hyalinus]|nr:Canalicular multispecific organic anion transporter 2 [Chytriomyces hyalinus]